MSAITGAEQAAAAISFNYMAFLWRRSEGMETGGMIFSRRLTRPVNCIVGWAIIFFFLIGFYS